MPIEMVGGPQIKTDDNEKITSKLESKQGLLILILVRYALFLANAMR